MLAVVTGLSMVRNDIGVVIAGRNFRNYIDTVPPLTALLPEVCGQATVQQNNYNWEQLVRTEHWSRRQWLAKCSTHPTPPWLIEQMCVLLDITRIVSRRP